MQRGHPEWSKAKAEAQASVDFETAATELFVAALERGKALRPAALRLLRAAVEARDELHDLPRRRRLAVPPAAAWAPRAGG